MRRIFPEVVLMSCRVITNFKAFLCDGKFFWNNFGIQSPLTWFNVRKIDGDIIVSVRTSLFVTKAESMHQFVHYGAWPGS